MIDKKTLIARLGHMSVSKEDRLVFAKALDIAGKCPEYGTAFTDFLDPVKAGIITDLLKSSPLYVCAYGGLPFAERLLLGFSYSGETDQEDFPIVRVKITFNAKFNKLTHRDFLGAILGLPVDRSKIGDIYLQSGCAYVLAKKESAAAITKGLFLVGKAPVSCEIVDFMELGALSEPTAKSTTVASPRLDAVLSRCFNISRGDAADFIRAEKVFVNWAVCRNFSQNINDGDTITMRGVGRVKIVSFSNTSKSGRIFVDYMDFSGK